VLNGQKVWTTFGPWADWIFFVLARTDSKDRYGGISFILTKLDTPGITVRRSARSLGESGWRAWRTRASQENPRRQDRRGLADRHDGARLRAGGSSLACCRALARHPALADACKGTGA
jgi:hypothetical protein